MPTWSLRAGDPLALRLAADFRGAGTDPFRDLVWDLSLTGGDPAALTLTSGYGQPGREVRIFPSFRIGTQGVLDPDRFSVPPVVRSVLPSFLRLEFEPFPLVAATMEVWISRSDTAAARIQIENRSAVALTFHLAVHASLRGSQGMAGFRSSQKEGAKVLVAEAGSLAPVLFLTGGAEFETGAYPGLGGDAELEPGASRRWTWVHAAGDDEESSFALARETAGRAWDAETGRLERAHGGRVEIQTGDPAWNAVLAQTQTTALTAFVGTTRALAQPAFVTARQPDRGYSALGDGKDFDAEWCGQNIWSAWSLAHVLIWSAPDVVKGMLRNLLSTQDGTGHVDAAPDLAGRPAGFLCPPLLASLTHWIFEHTQDREFLQEVVPRLVEFAECWFGPAHDQDGDGWPEWENCLQAGLRSVPAFVPWHPAGAGADVRWVESIDLACYLLREMESLLALAQSAGDPDHGKPLAERVRLLRRAVEERWDPSRSLYRHRDRDSHAAPSGVSLGKRRGDGPVRLHRELDPPSRIVISCHGAESGGRALHIALTGVDRKGERIEERLSGSDFQWFWESGIAASKAIFRSLETVNLRGGARDLQFEIRTEDLRREDAGLLLPLWANVPDRSRQAVLVRESVLDATRFWRRSAVPACSASDPGYRVGSPESGAASMVWNAMLCDGLVQAGFRLEAADLLTRLMEASVRQLRERGEFAEFVDPEGGPGVGTGGHINGLFPLGSFLNALGVRLLGPRSVVVEGETPFPWPVEVRWRGLVVTRGPGQTQVTFPDGSTVNVPAGDRTLIQQKDEAA